MPRLLSSCLLGLSAALACAQVSTNQAALEAFAQRAHTQAQAKKEEARFLANLYGIPVVQILPGGRIAELMEFHNGRPIYYATDNENAALTTRANRLWPGGSAGLALTGLGVTLGIWDGGAVRTTHQEFGGRVTVTDSTAGIADHATHVAGTMIAAGVDAKAKGMSYQALLKSNDWNSDDAEMAAQAAAGLRISNHSYGFLTGWEPGGDGWYWWGDFTVSEVEDVGFGYYDATSQTWDNLAYNAPYYLICKSAGNDRNDFGPAPGTPHFYWNGTAWATSTAVRNVDGNEGYDSIPWNGIAKNILTVGAVDDVTNYTGPSSVAMSAFSGWGPTDDGRIKPDISADGVTLYSSTAGSDTAYSVFSGTSMSTPNVAGSLGLVVQHHRNLKAGADMLAATLKGLAIHTADEAGDADGPDYAFGWGLLNVERAAELISEDSDFAPTLREEVISNGETKTYQVECDSSKPLRVTICWTDPAHAPEPYVLDSPVLMLVNDLDLRVTAPDGTTVTMPWVLDPAHPSAAATKGDNFRDNVEQVLVPTTVAGTYTIRVTHKGASLAPSGQQAFSMITSGHVTATSLINDFILSTASVAGGATLTGTVTLNGTAGGVVELSSSDSSVIVPATVTVPAGQSSATFNISTAAVSSKRTVTVSASRGGLIWQEDVEVKAPILSAHGISPAVVLGGNTATGTVTISSIAPVGGIPVMLSSNNAKAVVPASVTVPAGQVSATYTINTGSVTTYTNVTIVASWAGATNTGTFRIEPVLGLASLAFSPGAVAETGSVTGTVTLSKAAPAGGVTVSLAETGGTSLLTLPASVVVPAGSLSTTFTAVAKSVGSTAKTVTVQASGANSTASGTLTINPVMVTGISLNPNFVKGGATSTGTVTISTPAGAGGLVVTLVDNSDYASVPPTVTIPAGATSATFTVTTSTVRIREYATIIANRNGQSKAAVLTIDKTGSGGGAGSGG